MKYHPRETTHRCCRRDKDHRTNAKANHFTSITLAPPYANENAIGATLHGS